MVGKRCDYCGTKISKEPNRIEEDKHDFCSRECKIRFQGGSDLTKEEKKDILIGIIRRKSPLTSTDIIGEWGLNTSEQCLHRYLRELREENNLIETRMKKGAYVYYHKKGEKI